MNNSDLSLEFLKKCQKCRESGVDGDIAILAALHDLADYKDQHPREGLWDAQKVIEWLNTVDFSKYVEGLKVVYVGQLKDDLIKAMEE